MGWGKLDDKYHSHRKTRVSDLHALAAIGLHALGISYSADHETDGRLDGEWIEDKLFRLRDKDRAAVLKAAADKRLLVPDGDDYLVNDYTDYNPSRSELEERRAKDRERKQSGSQKDSARNLPGGRRDSKAVPKSPSRAGPRAPGRAGGEQLGQVVEQILARLGECARWTVNEIDDRQLIERTVLATPDADHLAAATAAVAKGNDPKWKTRSAGRTFDYAVREQLDYSAAERGDQPTATKNEFSKYDEPQGAAAA